MDKKTFKKAFAQLAKNNGFLNAYGGWYKDNDKTIVVLELQKSNFSELYYLNIKIYIQMIWDTVYVVNKDLIKKDTGDIFNRQPQEFNEVFDLETDLSDEERIHKLNYFFDSYLMPLVNELCSLENILKLAKEEKLFLTPAVRERLIEMIG